MTFDSSNHSSLGAQDTSIAECEQLRANVKRLTAERVVLLERQRRVMELVGSSNPDQLIHDIRNVLNELNLLRALSDGQL